MPIPVRTAATSRFEIATESGYVPVDIRRHPRARSYTLRVAGPGKPPILTMPERGSLAEAHRFLERHAGWLRRQIDRLPPAIPIADGWPVPLRGVLHTIHHDSRPPRHRDRRRGRQRPGALRLRRAGPSPPPRHRFPQARGPPRHRGGGRPPCGSSGCDAEGGAHPRPDHPLGLLHHHRAPRPSPGG